MTNRVHHFKLVLLGDTAVGKSCLVVRFVRDEFFEFQEPTIGGKRVSFRALLCCADWIACCETCLRRLWYTIYGVLFKNRKNSTLICNGCLYHNQHTFKVTPS